MAEVTLLQHMSVLGVSFANTSDFSMFVSKKMRKKGKKL